MKIQIVMLFDDRLKELGETSSAIVHRYCARHGLELCVHRELINPSIPAVWNKLLVVQNSLLHADWVVWLDADTVITDESVPIDVILSEDKPMTISLDYNGLCCGIMAFKYCDWTLQLLETWMFLGPVNHDSMQEQGCLKLLYDNSLSVSNKVQTIPQTVVSNPCSGLEGSFIHHYWSQSNPERAKEIAEQIRTRL